MLWATVAPLLHIAAMVAVSPQLAAGPGPCARLHVRQRGWRPCLATSSACEVMVEPNLLVEEKAAWQTNVRYMLGS